MSRATYVLRNGELVEKHLASPLHAGHGSAPYVHSDTMDAVRNMADGRFYDSKSRYVAAVKAHGCEIVGNDRVEHRPQPMPSVRADLRRALQQLRG